MINLRRRKNFSSYKNAIQKINVSIFCSRSLQFERKILNDHWSFSNK